MRINMDVDKNRMLALLKHFSIEEWESLDRFFLLVNNVVCSYDEAMEKGLDRDTMEESFWEAVEDLNEWWWDI